MKTQYGNTISEVIQYDAVAGAVCKPIAVTQWYSDTQSTWIDFDDIESRRIELSNENKRYGVYSFMPPAKTINITLNNFQQIYSTGSGEEEASILKKNLKVRAWTGFELTMASAQADNFNVVDTFTDNNKFVHTQLTLGRVYYDPDSYTGTLDASLIGVLYDGSTYDATTYDYSGYYLKEIEVTEAGQKFNQVNINVSTNRFDLRWRVAHNGTFGTVAWSDTESLSTGANVVQLPVATIGTASNLQVAVLFDSPTFDLTEYIEAGSFNINKYKFQHLFKRGTYLLDEPDFQDLKVNCEGRDYLKKALETEINMPIMSGVNIATAMTNVLDRCGIPYATADWDTTSTTVSLNSTASENLGTVSGWKVLDFLMDAVNAGDDDWRLKTEDNGSISLKKIATDVEADYSIHYKYNIESVNKNLDSDKQLQRITMANKSITVNAESLLKSYSGTATDLTLTYGSSAIYVRYTDDNGVILTEDGRDNDQIEFTCTGSTADIKVYGCTPKNAITDEVWAERGNALNIINNDGSTYKRENPFFTQTMCNEYCDYLIGYYGEPAQKVTVKMVPNPYLELNDNCMVFDLYTYTDSIYGLVSIKEDWKEPSLKDTLTLEDRGFNLGLFRWDRNGHYSGINDLKYDIGFVWDQDLDIDGSDTATYKTPILF